MERTFFKLVELKNKKRLFLFCVIFIAELSGLKAQVSPLCIPQPATEAVQNGDFEDGYGAPATFGQHIIFPGGYSGSGQYYVGKSPKYFNIGFPNDFLPYSGDNMLMVDAAVLANSICWQQTVTIIPNRLYFFSAWLRSLSIGERCQLQFQISVDNGVSWSALGVPQLAPLPDEPWLQVFESWSSGSNTTAILRLSNFNPGGFGYGGNDFAVDDISFKDTCLDPTLGSSPVMPAEISLCDKPFIDINTNVPVQSDIKFTWYKDGVIIHDSDVSVLTGVTQPGSYTVCVDSNTCLQSATIDIVNTMTIDLGPDVTLCNPPVKELNTGIDPLIAGFFDIKWYKDGVHQSSYDGLTSITVDAAGTYRVDVTNNSITGCNASDEILISSALPIPNHVEFCGPNQTVNLSVTGTSTYRWYNAAAGGLLLHIGANYSVTPPIDGVTYYVVDASNPTCARVPVMAKVEPSCCYALAGTNLTSTVSGAACAGSLFNLRYDGGQEGDSLMLQMTEDPTGGIWTNVKSVKLSDPVIFDALSINDTTTFRVVTFSKGAFDIAGCKDISSLITIDLATSPVAGTALISPGNICKGEKVELTLTGSSGNIQWQRAYAGEDFTDLPGANTNNYIDYPTQSLVQYRALVKESICPNAISDTVNGVVSEVYSGNISGTSEVCNGDAAFLSLDSYLGTIQWQDSLSGGIWTNISGQTSSSFTYYPSDTVTTDFIRVIITDPSGSCSMVPSGIFTVVSDTCPSVNPIPIQLPNALTPNGDGNNDAFYIGNIWLYPDNHLIIFNRWGSKVFESKGYNNDWDGGNLPVATYYYVLELGKDNNGNRNEINKYQGTVTIVR